MYRPRHFVETDLTALDDLAARDSFITLITVRDAVPTVSHVPVLYRRDGGGIELLGHWALANPQAGHAGAALAIFHGPHAYVSPSWYPDKEEEARVPTWNYAVAHLAGMLHPFRETEALAELVASLSAKHEAEAGQRWRFDAKREDHVTQLRGIVGFRFVAEDAVLKLKLSQNHPLRNRISVAEHLAAQVREDSRDVAAMMARGLNAPD